MKTIEEAARDYAESEVYDFPTGDARETMNLCEVEDWFKDAFKEGVEFAQRWITVEDELPEIGEPVLVKIFVNFTTHYRCASIFYCEDGGKLWNAYGRFYPCSNTHWRLIEFK